MSKLERLYLSMSGGDVTRSKRPKLTDAENRYRYLFYVDFMASVDDLNVSNALRHLQEMTTFFRVLGSFPRAGCLVGLENLGQQLQSKPLGGKPPKRRVGVLGFGTFGQFIAKKLALEHDVFASSRENYSTIASHCGVCLDKTSKGQVGHFVAFRGISMSRTWCDSIDDLLSQQLEVLIISAPCLRQGY